MFSRILVEVPNDCSNMILTKKIINSFGKIAECTVIICAYDSIEEIGFSLRNNFMEETLLKPPK